MGTSSERYLFLAFLLPFLACGIPVLAWLWTPYFLPLALVGTGACLGLFGLLVVKFIQEHLVRVDIAATGTSVFLGNKKEIQILQTGKIRIRPLAQGSEAVR